MAADALLLDHFGYSGKAKAENAGAAPENERLAHSMSTS
jgi:hypothetical protein